MKTQYLPDGPATAVILLALLLATLCFGKTALADEERVAQSTHYSSGGRDNRQVIKTTKDSFAGSAPVEKSRDASFSASFSKGNQAASRSVNEEFWFYSADILLFGDEDFDGYYSGIDLSFDADTIYSVADVYAVVYLSYEGGPWEEYAVTDTFTIFGATSDDDYSVVTDLVSGYPTGSYDVLIELFDAFNDDFLAFIGPDDTSELSFLPLEDIARDTPPETTVVINTEGGGSVSLWSLLIMSGFLLGSLTFRWLRGQRPHRVRAA